MNLNRLKKSDILWLYNHYCKHGHRYTEHIKCLDKENPNNSPVKENIAAFDIETSNLKATFGIVFSYAFLRLDGTLMGRAVTPREMDKGIFDRDLLKDLVRDLKEQDTVITWFGKWFDLPFVRSRCMHYGLDFPEHKALKHIDLWRTAKDKLRLHSNRLQAVCEFLGIEAKGHPLKPDVWFGAMGGKKKSLDYIYTHNLEDVESTIKVYKKFLPYIASLTQSI